MLKAHLGTLSILEAIMRLSFVGITPNTPDNGCPAVYVDEDTGDIWIQGETVTDPGALTEVARHSPIGPGELLLPASDCWVFDGQRAQFNYFSGAGEFLDTRLCDDTAIIKQCAAAFEAVWERAIPHQEYQPR